MEERSISSLPVCSQLTRKLFPSLT
jgi:hypothetical protein